LNWVCEYCSSINTEDRTTCFVCGTDHTEIPAKPKKTIEEKETEPKSTITVEPERTTKKEMSHTVTSAAVSDKSLSHRVAFFGRFCFTAGLLLLGIGLTSVWIKTREAHLIPDLFENVKDIAALLCQNAVQKLRTNLTPLCADVQKQWDTVLALLTSFLDRCGIKMECLADEWLLALWDRCYTLAKQIGSMIVDTVRFIVQYSIDFFESNG